ncbi:hypothetical protein E4U21_002310 [Claviceps maximensis]|nr:hypothetical protein E4U21_002310 [Claviceps maximensis]
MDGLPTNILEIIFGLFCTHCTGQPSVVQTLPCNHWNSEEFLSDDDCLHDTASLRALCLTSRAFRAIAQPILHHELDLTTSNDDQSSGRTLLLFARTISQNTLLAGATQRITSIRGIDGWTPSYKEVHDVVSRVLPNFSARSQLALTSWTQTDDAPYDDLTMISTAFLRALKIPYIYADSEKSFVSNALLAIVIGLSPRLSSLSLSDHYVDAPEVYNCVFDKMQVSLLRLKHIFYTVTPMYAINFVVMTAHLEELYLHDLQGFYGNVPRFPHLRVLRIYCQHRPSDGTDVVERIIEACDGELQDFAYYQYHPWLETHDLLSRKSPTISAAWNDVPDLKWSLRKHRKSLKHLHLDVQQFCTVWDDIPSLANYDNVEILTISPWYANCWAFADNDTAGLQWLLPRNLRVLRLKGPLFTALWKPLLLKVAHLALFLIQTDETCLPSLTVIECSIFVYRQWFAEMIDAFSTVGIEFKVPRCFTTRYSDNHGLEESLNSLYFKK